MVGILTNEEFKEFSKKWKKACERLKKSRYDLSKIKIIRKEEAS